MQHKRILLVAADVVDNGVIVGGLDIQHIATLGDEYKAIAFVVELDDTVADGGVGLGGGFLQLTGERGYLDTLLLEEENQRCDDVRHSEQRDNHQCDTSRQIEKPEVLVLVQPPGDGGKGDNEKEELNRNPYQIRGKGHVDPPVHYI